MRIIDRFVLFIYSLAILIISVLTLAVFTQFISQVYLWEKFIDYIGGSASVASAAAVAAAAIAIVISLYILKVSVKFTAAANKKKTEAVVVHGGIGDVRITVEAVKNLADKKARGIKGVRDVKIQVEVRENADKEEVKLKASLVVGQENHIPEVSDQVRSAIRDGLTNIVGLEEFQLEIVVDDISNAPVQKQRVV